MSQLGFGGFGSKLRTMASGNPLASGDPGSCVRTELRVDEVFVTGI